MAAQTDGIVLIKDTWTLVSATGVNISAATWFNKSEGSTVGEFLAVVGEVTPTEFTDSASIPYEVGEGEKNETLSEIWLGIASTRLYAKAVGNGGLVVCNHVA